MTTINIARDFTRFPSGRYIKNGNTSGEAFRKQFLEPALQAGGTIVVEFDGTVGYGSSFLEEAFGGVVRSMRLTANEVLSKLQFVSTDASIVTEVTQYINEAGQRQR